MKIFKWPIVLGLLTVGGLLSALVADGVWDVLSWALLAVPVATGLWFACGNRPAAE